MMTSGTVYLAGAGPGDAGLLTLRTLQLLQEAEVIIYDRLIGANILKFASPEAEKLYAGKHSGAHSLDQDKINQLILQQAQSGKKVLRLKGGDPFLFGRGGEEAEYLRRHNIPYEVVPGVSSALAAPAYAGIPVTHRGYASGVTIITGHEDPLKPASAIDWQNLAANDGTLIILMGLENLASITAVLLKYGKDPATPAALIHEGTRPVQQVVCGTLEDIAARAGQAGLVPPVIIVIGKVAALCSSLGWFQPKPLAGKSVVVTRAEEQAGELIAGLDNLGAEVISFPVIKITAPPSWEEFDAALAQLSAYAWLVFTSVNGVAAFMSRLKVLGRDIRELAGIKIACIGDATARSLADHNLKVDIVPETYTQEGLLAAFKAIALQGLKVLIPRSLKARAVLEQGLRAMGAGVKVVPVYQTLGVETGLDEVKALITAGKVDAVTFTSASTVENFARQAGALPPRVKIICIGPVSAQAAEAAGYRVTAVAKVYNIGGLVAAVRETLAEA